MDTATAPSAAELETLISDLNLIDRFGDQMSRSELMDAATASASTLATLLAVTEDPELQAQASVADDELQKFFAFPERYTYPSEAPATEQTFGSTKLSPGPGKKETITVKLKVDQGQVYLLEQSGATYTELEPATSR